MLGNLFAKKRGVSPDRTQRLKQDRETFKYCPACRDEFRPEFEHCTACDKPLVAADSRPDSKSVTEREGEGGTSPQPLSAEDTLVNVKQATLMDIKQVGRLLEKHGIASLIVGDGSAPRTGCCPSSSFILQVREEDLGRAGTILAEDFRRSTALDDHRMSSTGSATGIVVDERSAEISCPACSFRFVANERSCPECGLCF